jgi:uncharacterized membrane protein (DUF106 family)
MEGINVQRLVLGSLFAIAISRVLEIITRTVTDDFPPEPNQLTKRLTIEAISVIIAALVVLKIKGT